MGAGAVWGERARRWSIGLPLLALAVGALCAVLSFEVMPVLGDEGVTAVDAWRIVRGEVPQRDFFEIVPPLSAGLLAGVYRLVGVSVTAGRSLGLLYGLALLGLTWAAARPFCGKPAYQALPVAMLAPFGVGVWPFPSHHWLADLMVLVGLLALLRAVEGRTLPWATVGGIALAGACFALQDQGGYAVVVALLVVPWFVEPPRRRDYLLGLTAGGLAVAALVFFLWLPAAPGLLWHDWVTFPFFQYRRGTDNAVGLIEGCRKVVGQWDPTAFRIAPAYTTTIALASLALFLLPFAFPAAAASLWRDPEMRRSRWALLVGLGAAFVGTALHRWSLMNLIWAAPLPMVAASAALERASNSPRRPLRLLAGATALVLVATFLGFGILRIAFLLRTPGHAVSGSGGSYRTFNPLQARQLQEVLDAIEANVPKGEGAFIRGNIPLVSLLTLRPNPTPFTIYLPSGYQTPDQADRWTRSMETRSVRWGFSPDTPPDPSDPADVYLASHYRVVWRNGTYSLWERNP